MAGPRSGHPEPPGEIDGPLTVAVDIPDWFQTQSGNPNSVDDEISNYIHERVLIPLNNGACRVDPGTATVCPARPGGQGPDREQHLVLRAHARQLLHRPGAGPGYERRRLREPSGSPACSRSPSGGGFLGCLKGWFINYVTSGTDRPRRADRPRLDFDRDPAHQVGSPSKGDRTKRAAAARLSFCLPVSPSGTRSVSARAPVRRIRTHPAADWPAPGSGAGSTRPARGRVRRGRSRRRRVPGRRPCPTDR